MTTAHEAETYNSMNLSLFVILFSTLTLIFSSYVQNRAEAAGNSVLKSCKMPGIGEAVKCGTYEVWEDPAARSGRKIPMKIVVLPATGKERKPDPVMVFTGGPGDSVIEATGGLAYHLAFLRKERDLLLIDQRGTGGSNPLIFPLYAPGKLQDYFGPFFPTDSVRKGREAAQKKADLRFYTTTNSIEDFEAVRRALGYQKVNLFAISYGTRVALVYLRKYPEAVRSAILNGVSLPNERMPMEFPRHAQRALEGVLQECLANKKCRRAYPNIRQEARQVFERLDGGPVQTEVAHPVTGELEKVMLPRSLVAETIRYMLYQSSASALVPMVLHEAAKGNFQLLAELAIFGRRNVVDSGSNGLYLSVSCTEDLPFIPNAQAEKVAAGTFLGDYRLRDQQAACKEWPQGLVPKNFHDPVKSNVPVLIFSGQWDPVTPPENAEAVSKFLPNSLAVTVPQGGHNFTGLENLDCLNRITASFISKADVKAINTDCLSGMRRPPFALSPPPMQVVSLRREQISGWEGCYAAEDGTFQVNVKTERNKLIVVLPDGRNMLFLPASSHLFRLVGPPGTYLNFSQREGKLATMELQEAGKVTLRLIRK